MKRDAQVNYSFDPLSVKSFKLLKNFNNVGKITKTNKFFFTVLLNFYVKLHLSVFIILCLCRRLNNLSQNLTKTLKKCPFSRNMRTNGFLPHNINKLHCSTLSSNYSLSLNQGHTIIILLFINILIYMVYTVYAIDSRLLPPVF